MKIVMDFRKYDGVVGGVEQGVVQVTKQLVKNKHSVILLSKQARIDEVKSIFKGSENVKHIPLPVRTHAISFKNVINDSFKIQKIGISESADLIHFPYNWSFPLIKKLPTIITIHDVIPFTFREAMGLFKNLFIYKPAIRMAAKLNDIIATVSEFSKLDISSKVGVPADKIKVIPNGIRHPYKPTAELINQLTRKFGLENGFVLNVGGIHERKNIVRLIHAFAKLLKEESYPGKLVITGKVSGAPYQEKMKKLCDRAIEEEKIDSRVVFTGFISDEELDNLFSMADLFVYPSLYEGFGIPVLEAMNIGTPVITSNTTALSEVADNAALLINPEDVNDIYQGMKKLLNDKNLKRTLIQKGRKRASEFSWEKTADMYIELYNEIINKS